MPIVARGRLLDFIGRSRRRRAEYDDHVGTTFPHQRLLKRCDARRSGRIERLGVAAHQACHPFSPLRAPALHRFLLSLLARAKEARNCPGEKSESKMQAAERRGERFFAAQCMKIVGRDSWHKTSA